MMPEKADYLIIGGGIAGVTAAETIRQRDDRGRILIIGAEPYPLYSRVLLPHVADRRTAESRIILKTVEMLAKKGIEYAMGTAAAWVDVAGGTVMLADGRALGFGKLLIATGSDARQFDGPGGEHCAYFRTLADLRAFETAAAASDAVVYGGGFNALDLSMSLSRRGVRVTAVTRGDGFLARVLDPRSRDMIAHTLVSHGIVIRPRIRLVAVEKNGRGFSAYLSDETRVACGAVGVSIGVVPNVGFLRDSGIATAAGVLVDERLAASPNVYAAGDVAEFTDVYTGERRIAGNWQNAMFQGRAAGANMAGDDMTFDMVTSYAIPCFDLPVCVVGAVDAPGCEHVVRETDAGASLQLLFKNDRVVAATCVGPFTDRKTVQALIAGQVSITGPMREILLHGALERLLQ